MLKQPQGRDSIYERNGNDIFIYMIYCSKFEIQTKILKCPVFSPASLLARCPCRGASGLVAVVLSSTQLVPPAAPSVRPLGEDPTPGGCVTGPAGRTVVGLAHAAPWPTPLTVQPARCAATPEQWCNPRVHLKTSPGPSAPAAAPVP